MGRSFSSISLGIASGLGLAAAAHAQSALPGGTSVPGTGDASRISAGNRESNADYNRLVGAGAKGSTSAEAPAAKKSAPVAATSADLKVGSALRDVKGVPIGTVSEVDADGVVISTATTKIKVPTTAFGKDSEGLMLGITADKFNQLIAQAHASH